MTLDPRAVDQMIRSLQQQLASAAPGSPDSARLNAEIGRAILDRFRLSGELTDLDAGIRHLTAALAALPAEDPDRIALLTTLGDAWLGRYRLTSKDADLDAGMRCLREAGVETRDRVRFTGARIVVIGGITGPEAAPGSADTPDDADSGAPPKPRGPLPPAGARPTAPAPLPPPAPTPWSGPTPEATGALPPVPAAPQPPAPQPREPQPFAPQPAYGAPPAPGAQPVADTRLEFAAAYRRVVERERRYPLVFFVHRPHDRELVRSLIDRRAAQLGGAPEVAQTAAARAIESGTSLTIVPNVIGATFEPSRIDVIVDDSVRELTFQMTVPAGTPIGGLDGYIDIFVGPLIIGQVPVAFEVGPGTPVSVPVPDAGEQFLTVSNASIFDKIFISYSHQDSPVVDLCVATYQGLGVQVLVDRLGLHSGDDWRATLESMIRESDVFQLYWSTAAAASREVDHEWRLALELSKARDRFIRPLYWQEPMPSLPEALSHVHFSRLDLKLLRRAAKAHAPHKPGLLRRAASLIGWR